MGYCFTVNFSLFLVPAVLKSLLVLPLLVYFFLFFLILRCPCSVHENQRTIELSDLSCSDETAVIKALPDVFRFVSQWEAETGNGSVCCLPSIFVTTVKT